MEPTDETRIGRPPPGRRSRRRIVVAIVAAALLVAVVGTVAVVALTQPSSDAARPTPTPARTPTATPTPTPEASGAADALLATTDDPNACAVSFDGTAVDEPPMLQTQGALYSGLPIPRRDGHVFVGWYETAADAASLSIGARVNGADLVACPARQVLLHGAWKTPDENAAEDAQVPILLYHQFTSAPEGKSGERRDAYVYTGDFDAQMDHIATTGFYLPTWDELSAFIDGDLFLPARSVIVTDDDADTTWFELAAPIVARHRVLTTSFMITARTQDPPPNAYVLRRSHTNDLHQRAADGRSLMVSLPVADVIADMETSYRVLGVKEVVAYPYGQTDDELKAALRDAGWDMARTTARGYVSVGSDKLALPSFIVPYGMGIEEFRDLIG